MWEHVSSWTCVGDVRVQPGRVQRLQCSALNRRCAANNLYNKITEYFERDGNSLIYIHHRISYDQ